MKTDETGIICRASAHALSPIVSGSMMYMPAGLHTITPFGGTDGDAITVNVEPAGVAELERQAAAIRTNGKRPFVDFSHDKDSDKAAFWIDGFAWQDAPEPGIYCRGEWTGSGRAAVEAKDFRYFSPVFHVDKKKGTSAKNPARIVCRDFASANMGGLVNEPAFHKISPLWAKQASGAAGGNQHQNQTDHMNEQELAALRAKIQEQNEEITALKAKQADAKNKKENSELIDSAITAKQAELRASLAEEKLAAIEAKNAKLEADDTKRREQSADATVAEMIADGRIAAKDEPAKAAAKKNLTDAPETFAPIYAKLAKNPALASRITVTPVQASGRVSVTQNCIVELAESYAAVVAKQRVVGTMADKRALGAEAGAIWARDLRDNKAFLDMPIQAANSLGTQVATLVSQKALELLKFVFPMMSRISSGFTDEQVKYGQTVTTRTRSIPTVGTYNTSTGYAQTDQTAADVSIVINRHKYVQTTLGANVLSGTVRNLFEEFAEPNAYAMAKEMIDYLYGLILAANFTATVITAAQADFNRSTVIDMGVAQGLAGVPQGAMNRTLLLYSTYFGQLAKDSAIVTLASFQRPEIITDGVLPNVHGYMVIDAPNLPGNSENLVGFGFSHSALALAARLPIDYTQVLPGASFGSVTVVTNPDNGMSAMETNYIDHILGTANQRLAWMYGGAVGQGAAGQRLTSA